MALQEYGSTYVRTYYCIYFSSRTTRWSAKDDTLNHRYYSIQAPYFIDVTTVPLLLCRCFLHPVSPRYETKNTHTRYVNDIYLNERMDAERTMCLRNAPFVQAAWYPQQQRFPIATNPFHQIARKSVCAFSSHSTPCMRQINSVLS